MLVAAAVCPAPPLLVPDVAAGAAPELADARTACSDALAVLAASPPDLRVLGGAPAPIPPAAQPPRAPPRGERGGGGAA
ncbi:hypothetical protein ACFV1T_20330, partial [Streptomyces vinaceus]